MDKSLVTATGEHEVRYQLLETVRAYAADRLAEAGEADAARAAHAEYFVTLAERAEPELRARDQVRVAEPAERGARQLRGRRCGIAIDGGDVAAWRCASSAR